MNSLTNARARCVRSHSERYIKLQRSRARKEKLHGALFEVFFSRGFIILKRCNFVIDIILYKRAVSPGVKILQARRWIYLMVIRITSKGSKTLLTNRFKVDTVLCENSVIPRRYLYHLRRIKLTNENGARTHIDCAIIAHVRFFSKLFPKRLSSRSLSKPFFFPSLSA